MWCSKYSFICHWLAKRFKKCKYLTAHASGGFEMLKVIKKNSKKINKKIKVLGVTILTSLNNDDVKIGYKKY